MTSPQHYVRQFLNGYPMLYKSPKEVLISAFTSRYSFNPAWDKNGNLVHPEIPSVPSMDYADLIERDASNQERLSSPALYSLGIAVRLRIEKERTDRKFIETHLEWILEHALHEGFDCDRRQRNYTIDVYGMDKYPAFTFPDNINAEWAKVLYAFLGNWLPDLAGIYGYAPHVKGSVWQDWIVDWPEDVKTLYALIMDAQERLHPHVYNGQSYAEYKDKMKKIVEKLDFSA